MFTPTQKSENHKLPWRCTVSHHKFDSWQRRCAPRSAPPRPSLTAAAQPDHASGSTCAGCGRSLPRLRATPPRRGPGHLLLRLRAAPPRRRPVRGRLLLRAVGGWTPGRQMGPEDRRPPAAAPRLPPHHPQGASRTPGARAPPSPLVRAQLELPVMVLLLLLKLFTVCRRL